MLIGQFSDIPAGGDGSRDGHHGAEDLAEDRDAPEDEVERQKVAACEGNQDGMGLVRGWLVRGREGA